MRHPNTARIEAGVPTQQFVRASFKGQRKSQTGPVHSNQALQPVKVLPLATAVGPSRRVSSEQSKAVSHENDSHIPKVTQWNEGYTTVTQWKEGHTTATQCKEGHRRLWGITATQWNEGQTKATQCKEGH